MLVMIHASSKDGYIYCKSDLGGLPIFDGFL